jgi:hypothetical protein
MLVSWEPGTRLDAIEASCGVNVDHGLRRTNGDKRKAVSRMFEVMTARGENWSDREIARRCAINERSPILADERPKATGVERQSDVRTGADGRAINVTNIGNRLRQLKSSALVDLDTGEILARPSGRPEPDHGLVARESLITNTLSTGLPANRVSEAMAAASLGRATIQPINSIRDSLASLNHLDPARALEAWIDAGEPSDLVGVLRQAAGAIEHYAESVERVRSQPLRAVK